MGILESLSNAVKSKIKEKTDQINPLAKGTFANFGAAPTPQEQYEAKERAMNANNPAQKDSGWRANSITEGAKYK